MIPCPPIVRRVARHARRAVWHHSHHPVRKAVVATSIACGAAAVTQFERGGSTPPRDAAPPGPPSALGWAGHGALAPHPDWSAFGGWAHSLSATGGTAGWEEAPRPYPAGQPADQINVPEPSSFAVVLVAVVATIVLRRRWR